MGFWVQHFVDPGGGRRTCSVWRATTFAYARGAGDGTFIRLCGDKRAAIARERSDMNISQAAEASGLPTKTIRYYEDIGLIRPKRSTNGYRTFNDTNLHQLNFLARARALGFSIEDCRSLLALWQDRERASTDVRAIAQAHLIAIETKIADLSAMQATLKDLVSRCAGDDRPDCPILNDLSTPAR